MSLPAPFEAYLATCEPLDRDEERELLRAVEQTGDALARERLIQSQLRLVLMFARQIGRDGRVQRMDLVQEGVVGLIEAIERFDLDRDVRFATYARFWIRARMLRAEREGSRIVSGANEVATRRLYYLRARVGADQQTPEALADAASHLGIDRDTLLRAAEWVGTHDAYLGATVPAEVEAAETGDTPEALVARKTLQESRRRVLSRYRETLSAREQRIFDARLAGDDAVPLGELGAQLGVSRQRVHQIQRGIVRRLHAHVSTAHPDLAAA